MTELSCELERARQCKETDPEDLAVMEEELGGLRLAGARGARRAGRPHAGDHHRLLRVRAGEA
ncbi:MAG: hypothetical protein R3B49_06315 [Phycisphaerales bacterium]